MAMILTGERVQIRRHHADRIMAVDRTAVADCALVAAGRTWALLNELLELAQDLHEIAQARPAIKEGMTAEEVEAVLRWANAVEVESRKAQAALHRHGIHPYDAVIGSAYNPALHERVGSRKVEGMGPLLVAEQRQRGYASQQPEFVLRKPQVYVTE